MLVNPLNSIIKVDVTSRWQGIATSKAKIAGYNRKLGQAMQRGIKEATEHLKRKSVEVTPLKTGELRKSAKTVYKGRYRTFRGAVTFNTPYAIYVHEDLDKFHAPGTYAKFLTRTAREESLTMSLIVFAEMRSVKL